MLINLNADITKFSEFMQVEKNIRLKWESKDEEIYLKIKDLFDN